jgi:2-polyprenyl-6-methoxyphenol hydroxylase-like FAD-dependent oxidoreductase
VSSTGAKADVAVVGGSVAGLATAMFYAEKGAKVVVIDPDSAETGDSGGVAPAALPHRRLTPQDRHSHVLLARGRQILQTRAPALLERLRAAGAIERPVPGQEELVGVMCRRTLLDRVMRSYARELPGVQLRDDAVTALEFDRARRRVTGVATTTTSVEADLVVDAAGRQSPVRRWLAQQNVATPDAIRVPCGTVYLTVFYRLLVADGRGPPGPCRVERVPEGNRTRESHAVVATFRGRRRKGPRPARSRRRRAGGRTEPASTSTTVPPAAHGPRTPAASSRAAGSSS